MKTIEEMKTVIQPHCAFDVNELPEDKVIRIYNHIIDWMNNREWEDE